MMKSAKLLHMQQNPTDQDGCRERKYRRGHVTGQVRKRGGSELESEAGNHNFFSEF